MKKPSILIVVLALLLVLPALLVAQAKQGQDRIDSLLAAIPGMAGDTNKVQALTDLSFEYYFINPAEGEKVGLEALALAEKLDWKLGIAKAANSLGANAQLQGNVVKALERFQLSLRINQELGYKSGQSSVLGNIGAVYSDQSDYPTALKYYLQSLKLGEEIGDKDRIANEYFHIGNIYYYQAQYPKALEYLQKAKNLHIETGDQFGLANTLVSIGVAYFEQRMFEPALKNQLEALALSEKLGNQNGICLSASNIGDVYYCLNNFPEAMRRYAQAVQVSTEQDDKNLISLNTANIGLVYMELAGHPEAKRPAGLEKLSKQELLRLARQSMEKAIGLSRSIGAMNELQKTYANLAMVDSMAGNPAAALASYRQHILYRDSVFNLDKTAEITRREMQFNFDKKQLADSLENQEARDLAGLKLDRQRTISYAGFGGVALLLLVSFLIYRNYRNQKRSNHLLTAEKGKSDSLLLNILPEEVASELKENGVSKARHFEAVTVLFTDFVNFTRMAQEVSPQELVDELHACFKAFDEIIDRHGLEKIKTIGDAYLAASGLPVQDEKHAEKAIAAALEIRDWMVQRRENTGQRSYQIRIGLHSGPVVAGIVGVRKFAYDIWGDTVNTAARMEQSSEPDKVNISQATYTLINNRFACQFRGEITAKNKGDLAMYFVEKATVEEEV